ncbi:MAG TPA: YggS family pyridoxal phosphate-dependent enzyme [Candidatus Baltobacteraceae bacterium]|jgi:hypothetical protein|nr:YggS family pyridoxal phosphate-dependent enzyme [Candidatus Baltobacteraceae bacterium]
MNGRLETIAQRYARLRAEVPAHVTIVGVSKLQSAQAVHEAVEAGVEHIGENYVQEAGRKFDELAAIRSRFTGHFIGHVQTNKAKRIAATFDMVQSLDRLEAADALAKAAALLGKRLPVLLQVNISPTERYGCPPQAVESFAEQVRAYESLRLDGIMAIGPITTDRAAVAYAFERAAKLWKKVGGPILSLGMSADWREAVAAGSTMIRAGSVIFGPRPVRSMSKTPG